jgi:hypothetical protein
MSEREFSEAKPFLGAWEEGRNTKEAVALQVEFGLSDRATTLIDRLYVATLIDAAGKGMPPDDLFPELAPESMRALAIYLSELEALLADSHEAAR